MAALWYPLGVLTELHLDPALREGASDARQLEWDGSIREMLAPGECVVREDLEALTVTMSQQSFVLTGTDADGTQVVRIEIAHNDLTIHITEYVDIVRQIALSAGSLSKLEVLDMAKKATHDNAARKLQRRCRDLEIDHPTARRLFTLLLTLKVDTTRLMGVHGHRSIR